MYVKNNILVEQSQCSTLSDDDMEMLHVNLKKGFERRLNIIDIYRPPGGNINLGLEK